jgi:citrate lyase subunit beta/citryl-CoA lyase
MRSKLFVPGSRPELFEKAMATEADALSIDLEDAVDESRKDEARAHVAAFLHRRRAAKRLIVRVNGLGTRHFIADLEAIAPGRPDLINLPMVERADDVRAAAEALAAIEQRHGLREPIGFLANIETPQGLRRAAEIAAADARVAGLQLGLADLLEPLGIDRGHAMAVQQIQLQVRLAAGESGRWACDSVFAGVKDPEGFTREAEVARRLGFIGKSCIHPSQVALANAAFRPTDGEIVRAQRIVTAAAEAEQQRLGAYLVDGQMIDAPFVARAREVVALAARLDLVGGGESPKRSACEAAQRRRLAQRLGSATICKSLSASKPHPFQGLLARACLSTRAVETWDRATLAST